MSEEDKQKMKKCRKGNGKIMSEENKHKRDNT